MADAPPVVCCGGENVHEIGTASSLAKGRISIYRIEPGFPILRTKRASTSRSGASVGGSNMQQQLIITPSHRRFKCPGDVQGSLAGIGRGAAFRGRSAMRENRSCMLRDAHCRWTWRYAREQLTLHDPTDSKRPQSSPRHDGRYCHHQRGPDDAAGACADLRWRCCTIRSTKVTAARRQGKENDTTGVHRVDYGRRHHAARWASLLHDAAHRCVHV
jgi:hypothetical protein